MLVAIIGAVNKKTLAKFDIKQPVFYADINWDKVVALHKKQSITFSEISKFPAVQRDLAIVVDKSVHTNRWIKQQKELKSISCNQ